MAVDREWENKKIQVFCIYLIFFLEKIFISFDRIHVFFFCLIFNSSKNFVLNTYIEWANWITTKEMENWEKRETETSQPEQFFVGMNNMSYICVRIQTINSSLCLNALSLHAVRSFSLYFLWPKLIALGCGSEQKNCYVICFFFFSFSFLLNSPFAVLKRMIVIT